MHYLCQKMFRDCNIAFIYQKSKLKHHFSKETSEKRMSLHIHDNCLPLEYATLLKKDLNIPAAITIFEQ